MTESCQSQCPGPAVSAAGGGAISSPSAAARSLSARQVQLLGAIRTAWPSGAFNNDVASLETLRRAMRWKNRGNVTVALQALRDAGVVRSEGRLKSRPDRWVLMLEEVAA